jgi:prophage regulatory protein
MAPQKIWRHFFISEYRVLSEPSRPHSSRSMEVRTMSKTFLRLRGVTKKTGLPPSSIYEGVKQGWFPKQVPLSEHRVAWVEEEIDQWQAARIAARDKGAV